MSSEIEKKIELDVVYVLFLDIVGYSKRATNEQRVLIDQLNQAVRSSDEFQRAEAAVRIIKIPTGDGMALVFYKSPEQPVKCALEISRALKSFPELRVRMGVHSGPISAVTDLNDRTNAAGIGINIAQRVMDCGDAGHILVSKRVAEDLEEYGNWQPQLHDLGEFSVKHGVNVHVFNLFTDELGNPEVPEKLRRTNEQKASAVSGRGEELWVAVLPFRGAGDADMESFAEGLVEDITTGLSRFRYLSVVASASAARLKGEAGDERTLGAKLGARYVLEGSIRKGGSGIRVSAQLVDTRTGEQLWAETYNRDLQASSIFAAQDDVAARIVATVADSYGVLVHSMRDATRRKDDADLTPVEWQFQYFAYREQITPSNYAALKRRVESVMNREDRQSDLWACLAQIYVDEYAFGFQDDVTSLDRALAAARRGVELDRANQFAMVALAQTHFFRQDLAAFAPAAERAMALNPLNTDALGILGLEIVHTGEFERGTTIVRRAMELNANHAGWMHFAPLWDHFHKGEYEEALECANRVDVPGLFWPFLVMASACGHLGRRVEAKAAVRDLLALDPEFAAHARSNVATWHFASSLMEPILEGLRKAGLPIPETDESLGSPKPKATVRSKTNQTKSDTDAEAVRANEGFWVAVLPFKYSGGNADLTALAEGLTEEIVTGLSRFSYLKVISRSSTSRYAKESADVRSAGKELGARYIIEGSLRHSGKKVRLSVQLVDAVSGAQLWAENYERNFSPEAVFQLQDDLVPRIVSTVADTYGVLPYSMSDLVRSKAPDQLTPYEALLRGIGYGYRLTPEEHAAARTCMERAMQQAPGYADGWAMLSFLYQEEYGFGFNPQPDPLERALQAARRATDAAPSNAFAQTALARTLFFRKEFQAFRTAAEQAITLNPMDGAMLANVGTMLAYSGDWERGCALIEKAMQLNPRHPGWYWFPFFYNAYRQRDYRGALSVVLKINLPGFFATHEGLAAVHGQLGERGAASQSLKEMLKLVPNFAEIARVLKSKWFDSELVEHLLDGLRKAGLKIPPNEATSPAVKSSDSKTASTEDGFWVAVLPFKYSGGNADLTALADGMTEEIVTGLSRFSYLRVIALGSTTRYASQAVDIRSAGKELGARYVMEGSLRRAGARLRVAAQLVDTISGAHLWAETYDRAFSPEEIFTLQDDLVPRIVSTVADMHGVLPRSMSEVVRQKSADQMSPYEALLRSFGYNERFTPEDLAEVRACLERAVQQAPNNAECWAMLSLMYANEYGHWDNATPDSLDRSLRAARKAVEAAPLHSLPYYALAQALYFKKEFTEFRVAADRAISLNPMDGATAAFMGMLIAYSGDWECGCALSDKGCQLNPNHPGWYCYPAWHDSYRKKDYRKALDLAFQLNAPQNYYTHAVLAMCYAQLGRMEEARKALRDMLALKPNYAKVARELHGRWIQSDLVEQLMDGLRKAGLEIPPRERAQAPAAGPDRFFPTQLRHGGCRRRILGRGVALQIQWRQRRSHRAGRGIN